MIYAPIKNKTVIDGGVSKSELQELIVRHDRVIMPGHGSPYGLLPTGQFRGAGCHIVDESMVELLKRKPCRIEPNPAMPYTTFAQFLFIFNSLQLPNPGVLILLICLRLS